MIDSTDLLAAVLLLYILFECMDTIAGPIFALAFTILMGIKWYFETRAERTRD